jgi:hypothetical protein
LRTFGALTFLRHSYALAAGAADVIQAWKLRPPAGKRH